MSSYKLQKQQQICKERPFALYELGDDLNNTPFNLSDYSALKFGSDRAARLLGYKMADKFYKNYHSLLIYNKCVIIPSAFNVVKIASTILAHHFMNRLNDLLTREGHDTVEWTTMHRSMSYISDYCLMSKEKRKELLEGDKLYINRDYIKNKVLLFVDDVTITGTHEDKIEKFLVESRLFNRHVFCYAVRYTGNSPEIESKLNHAGMNTLDDYIRITNEPNHHLVVRAIRFLLEQPAETLNLALDKLSDSFIDKLYFACLSKQYHEIEGYHNNFELIKTRYDNLLHSLRLSFT